MKTQRRKSRNPTTPVYFLLFSKDLLGSSTLKTPQPNYHPFDGPQKWTPHDVHLRSLGNRRKMIPIGSMYVHLHEWLMFMVNVGKSTGLVPWMCHGIETFLWKIPLGRHFLWTKFHSLKSWKLTWNLNITLL